MDDSNDRHNLMLPQQPLHPLLQSHHPPKLKKSKHAPNATHLARLKQ